MEASTTFSRVWGKVWQDSGRVGRAFWERWSPYWCPKQGKGSNFEGCSCLTCPFQYWFTTLLKWRAVIHVDCSCNQSRWSMRGREEGYLRCIAHQLLHIVRQLFPCCIQSGPTGSYVIWYNLGKYSFELKRMIDWYMVAVFINCAIQFLKFVWLIDRLHIMLCGQVFIIVLLGDKVGGGLKWEVG